MEEVTVESLSLSIHHLHNTMWRTRHKLNEAAFFLDKLNEHYYDDFSKAFAGESHVLPPFSYPFSYYLSAFVSSARSVTWVMRSEYSKVEGWESWFMERKPPDGERELLRGFNNLRVRSEKVEPLRPSRRLGIEGVSSTPDSVVPGLPDLHVTINPVEPKPRREEKALAGKVIEFSWRLDDFPEEELVAICREYHQRLSDLVAECEERFAKQVATLPRY